MKKNIKLITCKALAHLIEPMIGEDIPRVVLPISLHLNPDNLRDQLNREIARIEEPGQDIILGYGLCGRGLEGVVSRKSRLILPRVDDCIGAVLGSRARHKAILDENAGVFFLEPSWIGTEVDIFAQSLKGLDHIPAKYHKDIVHMALKHYSALALIGHGTGFDDPDVVTCRNLAEKYNLEFVEHRSDLSLLGHLTCGPWDARQFVVADPGREIPFF